MAPVVLLYVPPAQPTGRTLVKVLVPTPAKLYTLVTSQVVRILVKIRNSSRAPERGLIPQDTSSPPMKLFVSSIDVVLGDERPVEPASAPLTQIDAELLDMLTHMCFHTCLGVVSSLDTRRALSCWFSKE